MDTLFSEKIMYRVAVLFAVLMVVGAVIGGWLNYSPVPFWDMWNGTLEFFMKVNRGEYAAWWKPHNEHLILLSRLLFWLDFKWFGGLGGFLIVANYVLVTLTVYLFLKILKDAVGANKQNISETILGCFLTAWLFLWTQYENFTWGFQSQFFLAQLLPLCALHGLYLSLIKSHPHRYFVLACVMGVASVGTMANGIMALPVMIVYALLTQQSRLRVATLCILCAVSSFLFYQTSYTVMHHNSVLDNLQDQPLQMLLFTLLYLGNPFYHLVGQGIFGKIIALLTSILLVGSCLWFARQAFRQIHESKRNLALLCFILYIGGTALGTAGGRLLLFSIQAAFASRYTTPAIMAWAALFLLYAPLLVETIQNSMRKYVGISFVTLAVLMLFNQHRALFAQHDMIFERKMGALALALGVHDKAIIDRIFPNIDYMLPLAAEASAQNLTVFGVFPFRDVKKQLGEFVEPKKLPTCLGRLELIKRIPYDRHFIRVSGWIFNPVEKTYPQKIRFLNSQQKIVGYGLTGQPRSGLAKEINKKNSRVGYQGYLLTENLGDTVILQGENPACQMQLAMAVPAEQPFDILTKISLEQIPQNGMVEILPNNEWLGADYDRTVFKYMNVYGSYIHGDVDVGSVTLRLKPGAQIFYRSGPIAGQQFVEIPDSHASFELPVAQEWVLLDFSAKYFSAEDKVVKFVDRGSGWGEWSAIAIAIAVAEK